MTEHRRGIFKLQKCAANAQLKTSPSLAVSVRVLSADQNMANKNPINSYTVQLSFKFKV